MKSKYQGVYWDKGSWVARITMPGGARPVLGRSKDELDMARLYDNHARGLGKPLNFEEAVHTSDASLMCAADEAVSPRSRLCVWPGRSNLARSERARHA